MESLPLWHVESLIAAHTLSSCSVQAQLPRACGIPVPRPGIEPVSPALQGGFLTTGKIPYMDFLFVLFSDLLFLIVCEYMSSLQLDMQEVFLKGK